MASTTPFTAAVSGVKQLSESMEQTQAATTVITDAFSRLVKTLIPLQVGFAAFHSLSGGMGTHFKLALDSLGKTTRVIEDQRERERERLKIANQNLMATRAIWNEKKFDANWMRSHATEYRQKLIEQEEQRSLARKGLSKSNDLYKAELKLQEEILKIGRFRLVVVAAAVTMMGLTLANAHQANTAFQEANTHWSYRLKLLQSVAQVQQATGAQFGTVVEAAKSLIRYNLDAKSSFQANLKTVVQMHDALGLSTEEAAHLAAVTENYARASFQRVADVVATIVDQTALAAAEVKNLGVELTQALGLLTPGASTNLPQVIQALSGYEGALKEVTGKVGSFQKLVSHLATPEGMMSAGALGVSAKMIQTQGGIDEIMRRFERMTKNIVGQTEGIERSIKLDVVAQMMNLTRNEVNEMIRAMEIRRGQMVKELTLQERYNQEMFNLDQGVVRLLSSLSSLAQQGLYPLTVILSKVINGLASAIQWLVSFKEVGYVAMVAVTLASLAMIKPLWGVVLAFKAVAYQARMAAQDLLIEASLRRVVRSGVTPGIATGLATAATTAAGGSVGFMGFLKTTFSPLTWALRGIATLIGGTVAGVAAIVVGVAAIAVLSYKIWKTNKDSRDELAAMNRVFSERSQSLEAARRQQGLTRMREGDFAGALKANAAADLARAVRLQTEGLTTAQYASQVAQEDAKINQDYKRAVYALSAFGAVGKTPISQGEVAQGLDNIDKNIRGATEKQQEQFERRYKQAEKDQQAAEEHAASVKDWSWLYIAAPVPGGKVILDSISLFAR